MVLSKRERLIAIVTIAVLMIFALDRFMLTPILDARDKVLTEKNELIKEMGKASELFKQKNRVIKQWNEMVNGGLSSDVSITESEVLNAIRIWAQEYGLTLSSIKPEREKGDGAMKEIIFNVACNGSMNSVGKFLLQVQNSTLPLRITQFQLGSREEDGRELSLQLKLSALYLTGGTMEQTADNQPSQGDNKP
jgi:Tfp pilus assembly protein PilO